VPFIPRPRLFAGLPVHPAQKPEALIAPFLEAAATMTADDAEGGCLVLDPFMGSGSCAMAARKLNRRLGGVRCCVLGVDSSLQEVEAARMRLAGLKSRL